MGMHTWRCVCLVERFAQKNWKQKCGVTHHSNNSNSRRRRKCNNSVGMCVECAVRASRTPERNMRCADEVVLLSSCQTTIYRTEFCIVYRLSPPVSPQNITYSKRQSWVPIFTKRLELIWSMNLCVLFVQHLATVIYDLWHYEIRWNVWRYLVLSGRKRLRQNSMDEEELEYITTVWFIFYSFFLCFVYWIETRFSLLFLHNFEFKAYCDCLGVFGDEGAIYKGISACRMSHNRNAKLHFSYSIIMNCIRRGWDRVLRCSLMTLQSQRQYPSQMFWQKSWLYCDGAWHRQRRRRGKKRNEMAFGDFSVVQ